MFGNSYGAGPAFRTDRDAVVASLLYPRDQGAPDLASFQAVEVSGGAGFDAKTPAGVEVSCRVALEASDLEAAGVAAKAEKQSLVTLGEGTSHRRYLFRRAACRSRRAAPSPLS